MSLHVLAGSLDVLCVDGVTRSGFAMRVSDGVVEFINQDLERLTGPTRAQRIVGGNLIDFAGIRSAFRSYNAAEDSIS
jgi:PAS domain-containing protein|tara:strand:+ start:206 stop:439 length:234 start_codon:yes stop_codon:yes gene_type:complete